VADIHIRRAHALGLAGARKLALQWVEAARSKLQVQCTYEQGAGGDRVSFTRSGASGELRVTPDSFELDAHLGLLLGVFKHRIESEIVKNLDQLLAHADPHAAFAAEVAKRGSPRKTAPVKPAKARAAKRTK
jgi:putative polyhydroxyalkanoate system protein